MNYLSVCSGIEAATCAWHPLGWEPFAFSEIEKFPSKVLAHHYPTVPNLGDMTKFKEWPDATIDLLVGGTPCQSFSVAGLRKGLADPRGNLMLTYGAIARRYSPKWLVWENVPGVLSSNGGRDFGTFLGMLGQLGYGFAYRVLDAQFFGVAQRRRRVFVVGCLGDWRSAAAVLFERHSLQGNPAPSREAWKEIAPTIRAGAANGGAGHGALSGDSKGVSSDGDGDGDGANLVPMISGAICKDSFSGGAGGRPDGAAQGHFIPAIAFPGRMSGTQCASSEEVAPSMCSVNPTGVAYGIPGNWIGRKPENGGNAVEPMIEVQLCQTKTDKHAVAFNMHKSGNEASSMGVSEERTDCLRACEKAPFAVQPAHDMQVRRLTPMECERLQGFRDNYTQLTGHKADGPRYKALGNSMAVPVMAWIGKRIVTVDALNAVKNEIAA